MAIQLTLNPALILHFHIFHVPFSVVLERQRYNRVTLQLLSPDCTVTVTQRTTDLSCTDSGDSRKVIITKTVKNSPRTDLIQDTD